MREDPARPADAGFSALLSDVASGIGKLVKGELALARAEATEGLREAVGGVVKMILGGLFGLVGLNALAAAAAGGLVAAGFGPVWSPLIVGLGFCLIAAGLILAGRAVLGRKGYVPRRGLKNIRRDVDALVQPLSQGASHV